MFKLSLATTLSALLLSSIPAEALEKAAPVHTKSSLARGGRHGRSLRTKDTSSQEDRPPGKDDDNYIKGEYGKHIGPDTQVPPTPAQVKAERAAKGR